MGLLELIEGKKLFTKEYLKGSPIDKKWIFGKYGPRSLAYKILYQFEKGYDKIPDNRKLVFSNYRKK